MFPGPAHSPLKKEGLSLFSEKRGTVPIFGAPAQVWQDLPLIVVWVPLPPTV